MIAIISRERRWIVASLIAASISQAGFAVLAAGCIQHVFDALLTAPQGGTAGDFVPVALLFAAAMLGAGGLEVYRAWAGERIGAGYVGELRERLYERMINATPRLIAERRPGGLLLPFVGDLTAIKKWVSDGLVRLISALAMSFILLAALATRSPVLAGAAGLLMAGFAGLLFWISQPLSAAIREARMRRGAVANFVASSLRAAATIQLFGQTPRELKRLRRRNGALMRANLRLARLTGAMAALSHLTSLALIAIILAVGVAEVRTGVMTPGSIAAAMSVAGLLGGVIRDLGVSFELGRRAQAAFGRIAVRLDMPSLVRATGSRRRRPDSPAGLELRGVSISGLVRNARALAPPSHVTEVSGPSGSGKSALIAAIAGMREIDSGRILINGRDIARAPTRWLRRRIGLACPSVPLVRGTLDRNLRYRRPGAGSGEIETVIAACNLAPLIERLPEGLATRLGDGAPELSRGDIARVQIARAMLGSPDVLLLDEVDMHLDERSAEMIAACLERYPGVVILTATSPAFQRLAQARWRLEDMGLHASPADEAPASQSLGAVDTAGAA